MIQETIYKAAVYCRLSEDDGKLGDSCSIQTQKLLLEKYCKEQGFKIAEIYVDDGYTGLNFNRPSFKRILEDIDKGKVNLVITKDLSRFGRDYIMTGYYTEIYFQSKHIRYIAVDDNIDTNKENNDIAPFKNLLNDMYSKDLSKKVKSAKRQRALNGMFISGQTPFGYKKNPNNPNQLIIDEEVSDTIKLIFQLALDGKGISVITKHLTASKLITPAAYKAKQGDTRFERYYSLRGENWEYNWCSATVNSILKDMVYIGDMENRKYEVENYKTKKRVKVAPEKHIIVQNTHEAIISRNDYERVQELVSAKRREPRHYSENLFKSIIFCKVCGHRMHIANVARNRVKTAKVYEILYKCSQHFIRRDVCPKNNGINYFKLKEIVADRIRYFFSLVKDDEKLLELYSKKTTDDNPIDKYMSDKAKVERRLTTLTRMISKVYNDNAEEIIDDKTAQELLKEYQNEQKSLNTKLNEISKYLVQNDDFINSLDKLKENIKEFLDFKEVTQEMVNRLISKILISPVQVIDGKKTQDIDMSL